MHTNTVIVIALVALVALVVVGLLLWTGRRRRDADRHSQTEELREQLRREDTAVRHRESIAAERLQNAAEVRRSELSASREQLEQRRQRGESLAAAATRRRESEAR